MPGHFSPKEANFYCTMVFILIAEVSFSFISYVGIATLCCLCYWGAPPPKRTFSRLSVVRLQLHKRPTANLHDGQWTGSAVPGPGQDPESACHMPSRFPFPHLLASSTVPTNRLLHCVSTPMAANGNWATVSTHGVDPVASEDNTTHDQPRRAPTLHLPRPAAPRSQGGKRRARRARRARGRAWRVVDAPPRPRQEPSPPAQQ